MALACTVRSCGLPLQRRDRTYACAAGHSFDIAKQGYVNLLQPQDRRSPQPGDSRAAIDARAGLLADGVGLAALDAMRACAARVLPADRAASHTASVVELGYGSGELLAGVAAAREVTAIGIDLSVFAAEHAARRYPGPTWVVANADRRLPILDRSVDLVLSLHARRNPAECARILRPGGWLLVAVPAGDDLVELRAVVGGAAIVRDRSDSVLREHEPFFDSVERIGVRATHRLERDAWLALLAGTYRGARHREAARLSALQACDVTLASEIWVLRQRATDASADAQPRRFVPTKIS